MKKHTLQGNARDLLGRKVKQLRQTGQIPATIYGKKVKSSSVVVSAADFQKVLAEAGETGLVELSAGGTMHPVLIHNVQRDAVTDAILHVEFYQVDLKEKVKTKVPLVLIGESQAVAERKGVILSLLNEVEVEALPAELPEKIEVDVSKLSDVDQEVKVSELKVPQGVTLLTDPTIGVVKIAALVSKEAEAQAAADAAAAATVAAESAEAAAEPAKDAAAAQPAEASGEKENPKAS